MLILLALILGSRASDLTNLSIDCYAKSGTNYIFFPHDCLKLDVKINHLLQA